MPTVCPKQARSWFVLPQNFHSSWSGAGRGWGKKHAARQGYGQKINEQCDFDSYECCRDNKTRWCSVRVRGDVRGGDRAFLHFISRKVLLSETQHLSWVMGQHPPWRSGVQCIQVDRTVIHKSLKERRLVCSKDKIRPRRLKHSEWEDIAKRAGRG